MRANYVLLRTGTCRACPTRDLREKGPSVRNVEPFEDGVVKAAESVNSNGNQQEEDETLR